MSDTRVMNQECQGHIDLSELLKVSVLKWGLVRSHWDGKVFYYVSKTHFHQEIERELKKVAQK